MGAGTQDSRGKAPSIDKAFSPLHSIDRPSAIRPRKRGLHRFHPRRITLFIGFLLMVGLAGTFLYNAFGNNSETSTSNQVKSVFSDESMHEFTSPESKFSIMMPGFPQIEKRTDKVGGKDVPATVYSREIANFTKTYAIEVYDYAGAGGQKEVVSAVNDALRNKPGITIAGVSQDRFKDQPSAFVEYTSVAQAGESEHTYARFIQKDSRIYVLKLSGSNKVEFDDFAASLRIL